MLRSSLVRVCCLIALGLSPSVDPAYAVVVSTTQDNTSRPPDGAGWDNVGIISGATGVYLGNRWVLTVRHIRYPATVTFPEIGAFAADPNTVFQLQNPPGLGLSGFTDLVMYQLLEDPGLPPLRVAAETPSAGTVVTAIGNGLDRAANLTYWDVVKSGKWVWTETTPPGDYSGYKTLSTRSLRWGRNLLEDDEPFRSERDDNITTTVTNTFGSVDYDIISLITEFDGTDGNSNNSIRGPGGTAWLDAESQAVVYDSGGGLFYQNNGLWELAGITVAVEDFKDQPDVTKNAIFGNLTFYADLSAYRDQIETRYRFGDFDGDTQLTVADIDALTEATMSGLNDPTFDLNRDSLVDDVDRGIWVEDLKWTYFGDSNLDGLFDTADMVLVMQAGEYEDDIPGNSTWATGDWNGDGDFTASDFVLAFQGGGYEMGPRVESESRRGALVPEPTGLAWVFWVVACLGQLHRRRRAASKV